MVGPKEFMERMENLARNFDKVVSQYREQKKREFEEGKIDALKKELVSKKETINMIYKGMVDSVEPEISLIEMQIKILEELLR